tara:strand:+ start:112 stop:387 length:276 start_codon:yes stop_codon:yes gene_type:complete
MKTKVIVYTQQGCPHCTDMKKQLKEENIMFETRDIEEHNKQWDIVSKRTNNEYIPTVELQIEGRVLYFAPDRDWEEVNECVGMVKDLVLWD